jgi:hypothetical protein
MTSDPCGHLMLFDEPWKALGADYSYCMLCRHYFIPQEESMSKAGIVKYPPLTQHDKMRFWSHIRKSKGCWNWQSYCDTKGYGLFSVRGRLRLAHRLAWTLINGKIAPKLVIDHLCRNPRCVNPSHLEPVTQRLNMQRAYRTPGIDI